jgi:hypothetical protein
LGAIQKESQRRLSIVRQRLRWRPASKRQDAASRHSSEKRYDQYYHDPRGPYREAFWAPPEPASNLASASSLRGYAKAAPLAKEVACI